MLAGELQEQYEYLKDCEAFTAAFWRRFADFPTQEAAYEDLERFYVYVFGCRRYANFESFRQSRNRRLKK